MDFERRPVIVALRRNLAQISEIPIDELLTKRYEEFRRLGSFTEHKLATASGPS
jgi:hypothetical protein